MDAKSQFDQICEHIENNASLSEEEKAQAIRDEELAFREHQAQYEAEREEVQIEHDRYEKALEQIFKMCDCVTSDIEKRVRNVAGQALKGE